MGEPDRTTREHIADRLRETPLSAGGLARECDVDVDAALTHVRHVARSLAETDEQLLVAPPECADCGFDDFDDPANRPSRCPECASEDLADPTFTIE